MAELPVLAHDGSVRAVALIDDANLEWLTQWQWRLHSRGYVVRNANRFLLHRVILDAPSGREVDHINGDKLDNRRANLRLVTHAENMQNRPHPHSRNRSGHRGVSWDAKKGKWAAQAGRYIGCFEQIDDAIAAVRAYRSKHMPFAD